MAVSPVQNTRQGGGTRCGPHMLSGIMEVSCQPPGDKRVGEQYHGHGGKRLRQWTVLCLMLLQQQME